MRTPKVIIGFSRLADTELDQLAAAVVAAMTGNANFTTPAPTLASVTAANTAFQTAMSNAMNGGATETAIKDQKRSDLEALLKALALYVEIEADGDEAIMLSSGFEVSKQPTPVGPLPKPTDFKLISKGVGEIQLSIKTVKGAKSYQWEYKQVTGTDWIMKTTTKAKILLTGLESGKQYSFKAVPIGASDVREYSDVINSFVL